MKKTHSQMIFTHTTNRLLTSSTLLGCLLISQSALADATVVYEQVANGHKTNNTMQIKNGKIRFTPPNQENSYSLYDSKTNALTHVNTAQKKYISMDEQSIAEQANKAKQQMDQMRERMMAKMKDMPPEQKKQVEQMMNNHLSRVEASKAPQQVEHRQTSRTKTIAGIECTVHETLVKGVRINEICMTDANKLGIAAEDANALMGMQNFMKRMQKVAQDMMGTNIPSADLQGVPLHTTLFGEDGQVKLETRMTSISTGALKTETVNMPADYTPMQMPGM